MVLLIKTKSKKNQSEKVNITSYLPPTPTQDQGLDHFGDSPSKHLTLSLFVTEHAWAVQFGNQFPPAGLEQ